MAFVSIFSAGGCSNTSEPQTNKTADFDPQGVAEPVPREEAPSRYGNPPFYDVFGRRYWVQSSSAGYRQRGKASWYGPKFHGKRTSSGVPYNMYEVTAAHKSLPIPTYARVTRLDNGRSIVVKITDRGPFVDERIIDLSYVAAAKLDMIKNGTAPVEVVALPPYQTLTRNWSNPSLFSDHKVSNATGAPAIYYADAVLSVPTPASPVPGATQKSANAMSAPVPRSATPAKTAYLQIGAFSLRQSAEQLRTQLAQELSYAVVLDSRQAGIHRVRIGPVNSYPDLDTLQKRLATLGFSETHIVFD